MADRLPTMADWFFCWMFEWWCWLNDFQLRMIGCRCYLNEFQRWPNERQPRMIEFQLWLIGFCMRWTIASDVWMVSSIVWLSSSVGWMGVSGRILLIFRWKCKKFGMTVCTFIGIMKVREVGWKTYTGTTESGGVVIRIFWERITKDRKEARSALWIQIYKYSIARIARKRNGRKEF